MSRAGVVFCLGWWLAGCGERPEAASHAPAFAKLPLEITIHELFDLGVADINADGTLDIYSSNHNARSGIFLGDGKGGFGPNVLSRFGLDQTRGFPGWEDSRLRPPMQGSGLYLYWHAGRLLLELRGGPSLGPVAGTLTMDSAVEVDSKGLEAHVTESALTAGMARSRIEFRAPERSPGGRLVIRPAYHALPISVDLDPGIPLDRIAVGALGMRPRSASFTLELRDRHGMAWADFDADDQLDVFIARGGLKGRLAELSGTFEDELLCGRGEVFEPCRPASGLQKKASRARAATWVDYDRDGMLDLHVRAYASPDQLHRQTEGGSFVNVAPALGLDVVWSGPSLWLDLEGDGDQDLLIVRRTKLIAFVNRDGRFQERAVGPVDDAVGAFTVADYENDGDLDVLRVGPKGNLLLVNQGGELVAVDPASLGLPSAAVAAQFVDYDNDGRTDLHLMPGGLYRQEANGRFAATGLLGSEEVETARSIWFDADGNGWLDVVLAFRQPSRWLWEAAYYRNLGRHGHWLQVDLIGPPGNRQAIGARVEVRSGERVQLQQVGCAEGAHFSQGHYRLYFGLGHADRVDEIVVRWPDGRDERMVDVVVDRLLVVRHDAEST